MIQTKNSSNNSIIDKSLNIGGETPVNKFQIPQDFMDKVKMIEKRKKENLIKKESSRNNVMFSSFLNSHE